MALRAAAFACIVAALAGCRSETRPSPAAVSSGVGSALPLGASSAAPPNAPVLARCAPSRCTVREISEPVKAQLEAMEPRPGVELEGDVGASELATVSRIPWLKSLSFSGKRVTDLAPLAALKDLEVLEMHGVAITTLEPLRGLQKLRQLDLYGAPPVTGPSGEMSPAAAPLAVDLGALASLPALTTLEVWGVKLPGDAAPIGAATHLHGLTLSGVELGDGARLADLAELKALTLVGVRAQSFAFIEKLPALETLNLGNDDLVDASFLSGATGLKRLMLANNPKLAKLPPLAKLTELDSITARRTAITDLSPVVGAKKLKNLDVASTGVKDLAPLAKLPALQSLDVGDTRVSDFSALKSVKTLTTIVVPADTSKETFEKLVKLLPGVNVRPAPSPRGAKPPPEPPH